MLLAGLLHPYRAPKVRIVDLLGLVITALDCVETNLLDQEYLPLWSNLWEA